MVCAKGTLDSAKRSFHYKGNINGQRPGIYICIHNKNFTIHIHIYV